MFNWNLFPFTKNDSVNLDWIFSTLKKLVAGQESMDESVARAEQAAADAEAAASSIVGAVVYAEAQDLTAAEQEQARENIGAASAADLLTTDAKATAAGAEAADRVSYAAAQTLTTAEQEQARDNIGAASASDLATTDAKATAAGAAAADTLKYTAQTLTTSQQEQARGNIGAASDSDLATTDAKATAAGIAAADTLKYTAQTLTASQQEQARDNIGAASSDDIVDNSNLFKLSVHGSLTIPNASGRDVLRNGLRYALNSNRTIGMVSGNLVIACISSDLTNQMATGLQVPAPSAAYEVPLNCIIARATSDNNAINTSANLTRLYCNENDNIPRLYVDLNGNVYFRFNFIYSGTAGNYYFFWITPTLLLFDPDSNP